MTSTSTSTAAGPVPIRHHAAAAAAVAAEGNEENQRRDLVEAQHVLVHPNPNPNPNPNASSAMIDVVRHPPSSPLTMNPLDWSQRYLKDLRSIVADLDRPSMIISAIVGAGAATAAGAALGVPGPWECFLQVLHKMGYHKGKIVSHSTATRLHRLFDCLNRWPGVVGMKGPFPKNIHAWFQHWGNDGWESRGMLAASDLPPSIMLAMMVGIIAAVLTYKCCRWLRGTGWFRQLQTDFPILFIAVKDSIRQGWDTLKGAEPKSIQQHQDNNKNVKSKSKRDWTGWLVGGSAGVASGAAAPTVVTSAVSAIGFTANGIAGGSMAATMMSSAATASGGGVAAGTLIPTLQSIGATASLMAATGGGLALTAGIVAGGAVLSAAVAYGGYKAVQKISGRYRSRDETATAAGNATLNEQNQEPHSRAQTDVHADQLILADNSVTAVNDMTDCHHDIAAANGSDPELQSEQEQASDTAMEGELEPQPPAFTEFEFKAFMCNAGAAVCTRDQAQLMRWKDNESDLADADPDRLHGADIDAAVNRNHLVISTRIDSHSLLSCGWNMASKRTLLLECERLLSLAAVGGRSIGIKRPV